MQDVGRKCYQGTITGNKTMSSDSNILVTIEQGIMLISFNRPEKKNAITRLMYKMMTDALKQASENNDIRVVLFAGEGDSFTAGNDIKDFLEFDGKFADTNVAQFLRSLANFKKPMVAAVHGNAIGIGSTMLLHCDLVVAAKECTFSMPFVKLGICPEAASSLLLPNLSGYHQAAEILMLGESFNTEKAEQIGLINRVVETREVRLQGMALCQKLASLPNTALTYTKQLLKSPANSTEQRVEQEIEKVGELLLTDEAKAIFAAFLNR